MNVMMVMRGMDLHARTSMNAKEIISAQIIQDASMPSVLIAVNVILKSNLLILCAPCTLFTIYVSKLLGPQIFMVGG